MILSMTEKVWEKRAKKLHTAKDFRLFVKGFLKEKLKGLPPDFRLEVEVTDKKAKKIEVKIPAHSEGNPIRITQVDRLVEELEEMGLEIEILYLDDLWEREEGGSDP